MDANCREVLEGFLGMLVLWGKGWCSQGMGIVQNLLGMRDFAQI